jgi:hypothetical protein
LSADGGVASWGLRLQIEAVPIEKWEKGKSAVDVLTAMEIVHYTPKAEVLCALVRRIMTDWTALNVKQQRYTLAGLAKPHLALPQSVAKRLVQLVQAQALQYSAVEMADVDVSISQITAHATEPKAHAPTSGMRADADSPALGMPRASASSAPGAQSLHSEQHGGVAADGEGHFKSKDLPVTAFNSSGDVDQIERDDDAEVEDEFGPDPSDDSDDVDFDDDSEDDTSDEHSFGGFIDGSPDSSAEAEVVGKEEVTAHRVASV